MSGGRGPPGRTTMSEINVTPMVDVMLVLLIIFMVTTPLIQQGVKVNLPETKAAPVEASDTRLVISVDRNRRVYLGDTEIRLSELQEKLAANARVQKDKELYLHADRELAYGVVVEVMAAAQRAGVTNVGMITDPLGAGRPSPDQKPESPRP